MPGEIAPLFHRLRFVILILCASAALAGAWFVPRPDPLGLALAALGGFAAALARPLPALGGALLFACLWSLHAPVQLRSLLASSLAAALCLPPLALGVGFDEITIARGNRQRETALRLFTRFAGLAQTRWSISLSGAGLVLAVLVWFQIAAKPPLLDWMAAPVAAILMLALTRDLACALAALAASALLLLFVQGINGTLLLFLLFALSLGRSAMALCGQGDCASAAWMRAIEEQGNTLFLAGLSVMIAAGPRGDIAAVAHAAYGLIAALLLFPALAVAFDRIIPRRRSLEEMYRTSA